MGEGPAHREVGFEYRHHSSRTAAGRRRPAGSSTSTAWRPAGYDAARQQPRADRRSVRVVPARPGAVGRLRRSRSIRRSTRPTRRLWVNDEFKVSDKLTLTLGLRFDYQFARTGARRPVLDVRSEHAEPRRGQHARRADFRRRGCRDARVAGSSKTRRRTPGGRASASPIGSATRNAIRGGYGIYYAGVAFVQFVGQPTLGFQANLLAPNLTQRRAPGVLSGRRLPGSERGPAAVHQSGVRQRHERRWPSLPDGLTLPRFQNWSVTYQRQLTDNMMLDVSYIGNRGSRLNHHFQTLGVDANMNDPSVLALGANGAAVEHQLAGGAGGRHHAAVSGLQRQRRAGAAAVSAVPADRVARRADRQEPVPRAGSWCSSGASHAGCRRASATPTRRLNNNGAESAQGDDGDQRQPCRTRRLRSNGRSAPTTRRTCS